MTKVLAIASTLSKRSGGGRTAYELVSRLVDKVDLRILTEKGADIREFGAQPILEPRTPLMGFIRNCLRARRAARGVDVVHAFDAWPYGAYGYCAVVGTKRRFVINGIGTYSVAPFDGKLTGLMLRAIYRRASAILCISLYTKKCIDERMPGLPTSLMLQGTTKLPDVSPEQIAALRARLNIPADAYPILATVGEMKERKGQLDTLQALASLKKEFPHSLYIIVGSNDDEYVGDLREYSEKHQQAVRITSDLKTDEDLSCLYSIADIFALNSNNHKNHFEGFGLVLLEAAQFGLPAIGSKDCGIEDAINNGVSGILTGQMDHPAIANAIRTILAKHEEFRAGAREWYSRFTWEKTVAIVLKIYEDSTA